MGLTKRKDSYYVEFPVLDDGKILRLAPSGTGNLKRWKVGSLNKTLAMQHEAIIKTDLLKGVVRSLESASKPFDHWGDKYLKLETVKSLSTYKDRANSVRT